MSSGAHKYVNGNYNKTAIVTIAVLTQVITFVQFSL